jgi:hypothetical protein
LRKPELPQGFGVPAKLPCIRPREMGDERRRVGIQRGKPFAPLEQCGEPPAIIEQCHWRR